MNGTFTSYAAVRAVPEWLKSALVSIPGMVSLARGPKTQTAGADSDAVVGGNPLNTVIAAVCFLIVLAAIAWGIYEIYKIGHPAPTPAPAPSTK